MYIPGSLKLASEEKDLSTIPQFPMAIQDNIKSVHAYAVSILSAYVLYPYKKNIHIY